MATNDHRTISSTSKPTHEVVDNGKSIVLASDRSTDQTDSAGDQEDIYVQVTLLAKKVGSTGNTIQLKNLLVSLLISFLRIAIATCTEANS